MNQKFIFYDTETSGRDCFFDQIFQFAAVLTDAELNPLEQFEIRSRRMPHVVPTAGALLVNKLDPNTLDQSQFSAYEFANLITEKLRSWSPGIISGYNIFSFDERFMRSLFYQNLLPPYQTQSNGNTRIDILPLVQAAETLCPGILIYPLNEKGKTSKKLEHIASENGFLNHNAHDAIGDVEATIFVANLIRQRAPILWDAALRASTRRLFKASIASDQWRIFHDINFGWPTTFPGLIVGDVNAGRDILCLDLRHQVPTKLDITSSDIFSGRGRLFRVIRAAEAPLSFSWEEFQGLGSACSMDKSEIDQRASDWSAAINRNLVFESFEATKKEYPVAEYPEQQIYENFWSFDDEAHLMEKFHAAHAQDKILVADEFQDPRFKTFAKRIVFDSFGASMPKDLYDTYVQRVKERISDDGDVPWNTIPSALRETKELLQTRPDRADEINRIRRFLLELT